MKFTFPILVLCGLFGFAAIAQESKVLTLESAVQIVLEKNQTVLVAKNSVDQAQSTTLNSFGGFLPSLTLTGGFSRSFNWTKNSNAVIYQGVTLNQNEPYTQSNQFSTRLSSGLTLFDGFATNNTYKRAQHAEDATVYEYSRAQQQAIYTTNQLFLDVVRAYELLKVREDNLKRSKGQLERITESNKVGAVAIADVYRQRTLVGSDELLLIQAQSSFEKAKTDVLAYLGVSLDVPLQFDFTGIPTDIDTTEFAPLNSQYSNFQGLVSTAVAKRPDHLANIASLNGTESAVSIKKANYFPLVSASASYGYSNQEFSTLFDSRGLSLGIDFSLPIFNGFSTQTQIQQAQLQQEDAEVNVRQSQLKVTVDIRKALLDLEAAEKEVTSTQTSVQSAEMDRKIAEEKYNLGSGTILDLQVATANYTQAMSDKVNAVNDFLLAKKNMEFALGTIAR
jgi:outer membrane protein